ncbi:hypothetical protein EV189_3599 [Motilibacter rhizosphaerae]|uniref:Uncharacterized protein n=1 Tax=Motilibacter rhizosphaerae TaxID=598652 RepID=A0A4Q7NAY8_9ACTN|nr:hypothetical protein [Motilibacter rhizosphaerae]RZS80118.1 hypothetical protein EV189_3599 [Motilibacter rhizosphaerae]
MPHQVLLTFSAPVAPGRLPALREVLAGMQAAGAQNDVLPLEALPGTHFLRLLLLDDDTPAPSLVLMLDCDAPTRLRVRALAGACGAGLDRLFGHCAGYPAEPRSRTRRAFLRRCAQRSSVPYVHVLGRTVDQVTGEVRLVREIEDFLDRQDFSGSTARAVREEVRRFVASRPDLAWALEPPERPGLLFRLREGAHAVAVPALLLVSAPVVVPALLAWVVALRVTELRQHVVPPVLEPERMTLLGDAEDVGAQNAFTSIAEVKPGRFWALSARMSQLVGNYTARHVFTHGSLSGLRTVHFARFQRVGSRLLFTSYYDGSLESYNNDFVDQVAWVLNTVFGYQQGFPRTRWLVLAGARDERGFKAFIRGSQIPTAVWYSAYPDQPAATIDRRARARLGLSGPMSEQEAQEWLQLL